MIAARSEGRRVANRKGTRRGNGEGGVYRRPDGRIQVQIPMGYGLTGKRLYRYEYLSKDHSLADGNDLRYRMLREREDRMPVPPAKLTVKRYLTDWIEDLKELVDQPDGVRPLTWVSYELHVRRYLIPLLGHLKLRELTPGDVKRALKAELAMVSTKTGRTLSPRNAQLTHETLKRALDDAVQKSIVARNEAKLTRGVGYQPKEIQPLSVDEAIALLEALKEDRLGRYYRLALSLGLRRGEGLGARWDDVTWEPEATLHIHAQSQRVPTALRADGGPVYVLRAPKSDHGDRILSLPPALVQLLERQRAAQRLEQVAAGSAWRDNGYIFPNAIGAPHDPDYVSRHFAALLVRKKLPKKRLHDLRHSLATFLRHQGADMKVIQTVLGHASKATTENIYAHVLPEATADELAKIQELLG